MPSTIIDLRCPGCGAAVDTADKECRYCGREIIISTFHSVASMPLPEVNKYVASYRAGLQERPEDRGLNHSVGICYLKLKLYDKAQAAFERAMEDNFDQSETFFYAAVCLLKGKKAFLAPRADIDRALEYIDAALAIEPRGVYYYFKAYIKYDYFARKCLVTQPDYKELLRQTREAGISAYDAEQLFALLNVARPECM